MQVAFISISRAGHLDTQQLGILVLPQSPSSQPHGFTLTDMGQTPAQSLAWDFNQCKAALALGVRNKQVFPFLLD